MVTLTSNKHTSIYCSCLGEWHFAPNSSAGNPTFFLSMGVERTLVWSDGRWVASGFALPPGTLLYGESVNVFKTNDRETDDSGKPMLHAIDLMCVNFRKIYGKPLPVRQTCLRDFIKNCNDENVQMRDLYPIAEMLNYVKRNYHPNRMFITHEKTFYQAGGICFYRGRTIASKPVFWNWSTAGEDLMNPDADKSGYFAWFEKRLNRLPSKRERLHDASTSGRQMFRSNHNSNAR